MLHMDIESIMYATFYQRGIVNLQPTMHLNFESVTL